MATEISTQHILSELGLFQMEPEDADGQPFVKMKLGIDQIETIT